MRKWIILMDVVLLLTALGILLIDFKIKEDIIAQAKSLQGVIDGQRSQESTDSASGVYSGIRAGSVPADSAMASEAPGEPGAERIRPAKRRSAGTAKPSRGDNDPGISAESEQLGS